MNALLELAPLTRFDPPGGLTAAAPAESRGLARDAVRLLVAEADGVRHVVFRDLAEQLRPGDLVVVNTSRTVAGEVDVMLAGAGAAVPRSAAVLHVATDLRDGTWVVELRTAPDAARAVLDAETGWEASLSAHPATTLRGLAPYPHEDSSPTGRGNRLWRAESTGPEPLRSVLERVGRPIAYGYLDRGYDLQDYQSVFASGGPEQAGSAEMPSAARPFTPEVVTRLVSRGVTIAPVVLHTGVSSQEAGEAPQPEWFEVTSSTADLVNLARARGGRVVAVGTTVTRALESAVGPHGRVVARSGWTEHVVTRATPPRVVDGLLTGWHDPQASHLLLVEAIAGPDLAQRAYDAAVEHRYHWHEFGDVGLFLPHLERATSRAA